MFNGPSEKRAVNEYYADLFQTALEKELLAIINEQNATVEALDYASKAIVKEVVNKVAVDNRTLSIFKNMNLASKVHFLNLFISLRSAATEEADLRRRLRHGLKMNDVDITNFSESDLCTYERDSNQSVEYLEEEIRDLRNYKSIIEDELNPPRGGPSAPTAFANKKIIPSMYFLKMAAARNEAEYDNRRKELEEFQKMLDAAIQRNYEYIKQHRERARLCLEQLHVLEERKPRKAYAYK